MKVMKILFQLIVAFGSSLLQSLVLAWTLGRLWDWLVARDLGAGPSAAAWFGISSMVTMCVALPVLYGTKALKKEEQGTGDHLSWGAVTFPLTICLACLIVLAWARFVMVVAGW